MDPIEFLHLLTEVTLTKRHVDHRRLDVGMTHGFHDGEGVCTRHGHLGAEGMPETVDMNVRDSCAAA